MRASAADPRERPPRRRCSRERTITLLARRWCRGARSVFRPVQCDGPDAALRVRCAVPVVAPLVCFAVPVAAQCQTSPYLLVASLAWWSA